MIFRTQFPLMLSWAATFHKIQGQTLDRAVIDLSSEVWGPQMAYVAISRVRSLDQIALTDFEEKVIYCSPEITAYYKEINAPWKDDYPTAAQEKMWTRNKRNTRDEPNDETPAKRTAAPKKTRKQKAPSSAVEKKTPKTRKRKDSSSTAKKTAPAPKRRSGRKL